MMRTCIQLSELHECYGAHKSVHERFISWDRNDTWNKVLCIFASARDAKYVMVDCGPLFVLVGLVCGKVMRTTLRAFQPQTLQISEEV